MARDKAYREAEKKIQEALKSGATELDLRSMALTELPESIGQLTKLKKLDLGWDYNEEKQKNQLTVLPEWLAQLTQLQELNLSNNQLTTLPDSLGQLTRLQSLDLAHNQLTALPESLGQLTQLQSLYIYTNHLAILPEWLEPVCKIGKEENRGKRNHGGEVSSPFFIASGNAPELLETIDESFHNISLAIMQFVERTSVMFIATPSNGTTNMVTMEIASQGSTGVAFVGHQALGA